jgi:hypothetical protein
MQTGNGNLGLTRQTVANPVSTANGSLLAQVGKNNTALVSQGDTGIQPMIGANLQATVQVGNGNSSITTQTASASVSNTSVTAQFGSHNVAVVSQR